MGDKATLLWCERRPKVPSSTKRKLGWMVRNKPKITLSWTERLPLKKRIPCSFCLQRHYVQVWIKFAVHHINKKVPKTQCQLLSIMVVDLCCNYLLHKNVKLIWSGHHHVYQVCLCYPCTWYVCTYSTWHIRYSK